MKTFGDDKYLKILSELCKAPRPAGSLRSTEIREYLLTSYSELGYDVNIQTFTFEGWELLQAPKVKFLKPFEREVAYCLPVVWSGSIEENEVVGILTPAGQIKTFEAYPWDRYAISNNSGNPIAYIITRDDMVWGQPLDDSSEKIPYLIVDTDACKWIKGTLNKSEEIIVSASVKSKYIPRQNLNNIIILPKDAQPKITVCAHYDSFYNTVGAHDNASGTAVLLALAIVFSGQKAPNIKFAAFDAEELNKLGAYKHVEDLKNRNELGKTKLVINIDSVGVGEFIYILTSPQIESKVKEIVENSEVSKVIKIEISSSDSFPQFDSWPFMKHDIPVMQIGTKSQKPLKPGEHLIFHHPKDTLDNIDPSLIDKVVILVKCILEEYPA